jgi:uncharacterized protein YcbX
MTPLEITRLTIYPVKSMKGIPVDQAVLTPRGLAHDRRFMVVTEGGRFVTQRDLPGLALISAALEADRVVLSSEGHGSVDLPLHAKEGPAVRTRVWGDECETIDQGAEVSRWLTAALENTAVLRIVQMAPGYVRPQGKPEQLGERTHTYFADAAPFLVASESSLDALNTELRARGHRAVPMNRFRPNVVLSGLEPFSEHRISGIAGTAYALRFCHPCQRCVVTTIDQQTATRHPHWQPYRTLRDINPMPGNERAPAFGHNAVLDKGKGSSIRVGDRLSVMADSV